MRLINFQFDNNNNNQTFSVVNHFKKSNFVFVPFARSRGYFPQLLGFSSLNYAYAYMKKNNFDFAFIKSKNGWYFLDKFGIQKQIKARIIS